MSSDATTDATTTSSSGAQQHTIQIVKDDTNSYVLSSDSSTFGSFGTTYRAARERSSIRSAEKNLIITTITDDFMKLSTIECIRTSSTTMTTGSDAALPKPSAAPELITERTTVERRSVIREAESNTSKDQQHVEIKCGSGMSPEDMKPHYIPLPRAGQG
jgi:hypothetical protein